MPGPVPKGSVPSISPPASDESPWIKWLLIALAVGWVALLLVLPLASVFSEALGRGWTAYWKAISAPHTLAAARITLALAAIVVPLNCVFGVVAAWTVTKFQFRAKPLILTLIDLPFAVSPVVVGVMLLVLFGSQGYFGPWLRDHDLKIVFAFPGMVLATIFVTFPLVARELIPVMQQQGTEPEQAALTLGASGWQTFWKVTLPSVKWGVLYGVILANARAMGEFGAIYVISPPIPGQVPLPLWVDTLNSDNKGQEAFAVASLLVVLALCTLVLKTVLEHKKSQ